MHRLNTTNVSRSFQTTYVIETGLSDFNSMTLTVTAVGLFQKILLNTIYVLNNMTQMLQVK